MAGNGINKDIKADFGKRLRQARDAKKFSRQVLGTRLGVSPKTIQSWEMGRTFIENLSLIPAIERELDISVSYLINEVTSPNASRAAEAAPSYGKKECIAAGPQTLEFNLVNSPSEATGKKLSTLFTAVPVIKKTAYEKEVSSLLKKDIICHTVIPASWVPRGGVVVGCRMEDAYMEPMIPQGSLVILDRKPISFKRALGRPVAIDVNGKGMRIRQFSQDTETGQYFGLPSTDGKRGQIKFSEEGGDQLIGRVVGVMANW